MNELLPCPFCGESKAMYFPRTCEKNTPYNAADSAAPIVRCMGCYADVPGKNWTGEETAMAAWNRRAPFNHRAMSDRASNE